MQENTSPESACLALMDRYGLTALIAAAIPGGWRQVGEKLEEILQNHSFQDPIEKNVFLDLCYSHCLAYLLPQNGNDYWIMLEKWFQHRKPPSGAAKPSSDEQAAAIFVTLRLRDSLRDWLLQTGCDELQALGDPYQRLLLSLWQQVFLNMAAPHNMLWDSAKGRPDQTMVARLRGGGFPGLLAASMYFPLDADEFDVDCGALLDSALPLHCRNILVCWLINIPYFNGDMKHRDRLVRYVPELCRALLQRPEQLGVVYFVSLVQEIMTSFWRASYIGGNNVAALSAFGDLIHATINRVCPGLPKPAPRQFKAGERIRIGYISRNFYRQAVPYYMINRIIHHDRTRFEVFMFSLAERQDEFTDIFVSNSDHFEKFTDLKNFGAIINSVIGAQLDILIFTDIGMDAVTYILSGLRLAPVQCAMVGHGTTTGIPTMDYYISGDFESPSAQSQYREKLIRLPKLGAAQFLPDDPLRTMTRQDLGVPDDAVLFISCANGIKHRAERESLYIEILRQAPNAWVLLKPYTTPGGIDARLAKRLRAAATEAGVNDRLLILPSIGHYRSVLGLLEIADVQLDTYPYGGWTTNMEALYVGLPVVTQEGELSRSRWGAGMLRALGVEEGIATDEKEFVAWGVRFAQDHGLRRRVAKVIKARVQEALFDGKSAQPAFEAALLSMVQTGPDVSAVPGRPQVQPAPRNLLKQLGPISLVKPETLVVATSIAPRNYDAQREALDTWHQAGFRILAVNPADEIEALRPRFPDVRFIAAGRDARRQFGKPFIYFDDLLAGLAETRARLGGIINSDIYLINHNLREFLLAQSGSQVVFGSRFDAASPDAKEGKVYQLGFDFFFFYQDLLAGFPPESFCLGLPWWDFWAALLPLERQWPVKRLVTPVAAHVAHQAAWDQGTWLQLGGTLAGHFPPASPLSPETTLVYLHQCAQKINREARDVIL